MVCGFGQSDRRRAAARGRDGVVGSELEEERGDSVLRKTIYTLLVLGLFRAAL